MIRHTLNKLTRQDPLPSQPQHQTSPIPHGLSTSALNSPSPPLHTELPLSPDIIVVEPSQDQVTPAPAHLEAGEQRDEENDQSMLSDTNTIDDFVNEQYDINNLNCRALTIQSS